VGSDGPTHHGLIEIGYLPMMPNMVVVAPANDIEMKLALEFALGCGKPVAIRYPKSLVPPKEYVPDACGEAFNLGRSVCVRSVDNPALTIVSFGGMLTEALKAADALLGQGVEAEVINARFAAPVDWGIVAQCGEGRRVITVEDHSEACGFGSALLEAVAAQGLSSASIRVLGAPRKFIGQNTRAMQFAEVGVDADNIAATAQDMLETVC